MKRIYLPILNTLLLLFLNISSNYLQAQSSYVDSLKERTTKTTLSVNERIETLIKLSLELVYVEPAQAESFGQEALRLARQEKNNLAIATALRTLSSVYSAQDNFITSSDYVQKALTIFEQLQDSVGMANCYISLGHTFRRQKNREQEVFYHRKSYEIFNALEINERIGVSSHNLGESYLNIGKLDSALFLTNKAIAINTAENKLSVLSSCYKALGKIYIELGKAKEAEDAFNKVLEISNELGENAQKFALIESLLLLADLQEKAQNFDQQRYYLTQAHDINTQYYLIEFTGTIYDKLIGFYLRNGQPMKAREYLQRSITVLDSINERQQQDRSELMLSAIKGYKLEEETIRLENENKFQEKLIRQQRIQIALGVALLTLLSLAIFGITLIVKKLRKSNSELAHSKDLIEKQKTDLAALNRTKDKFFGIVSHDLRGPIGTVKELLELYFGNEYSLPEENRKEIATQVRKSMNTSYHLLVNLINWASIQMKKEEAEASVVLLSTAFEKILTIYEHKFVEKAITLINNLKTTTSVYVDENQLKLILRNLINNALKFTPENGTITISSQENDAMVSFTVSDTGVGISEEMQKSLFKIDNVARSTSGTKGEEGSGLGLILCKEYAEMNKGKISVDSTLGEGTRFTVELPKPQK